MKYFVFKMTNFKCKFLNWLIKIEKKNKVKSKLTSIKYTILHCCERKNERKKERKKVFKVFRIGLYELFSQINLKTLQEVT